MNEDENNNNTNTSDPNLPQYLKPLSHQVAGHFHGNSKTNLGTSIN